MAVIIVANILANHEKEEDDRKPNKKQTDHQHLKIPAIEDRG